MTTISIVGAGNVARGIATRAVAAGDDVQLLVRNQEQGNALAGEFGEGVTTGMIGGPIDGELVFLAVPYSSIPELVDAFDGFRGKVLVDATIPVNKEFTALATEPGTSGAQELQKRTPDARVVKAFNTVFASNVIAGSKNGHQLDLLVAADDADAKAAVAEFGDKTGFRVIDVGALAQASVMEAIAWLHMQLQFTRGTNFQSAIVILD